jgi:cyclopropane fatty-acyl-phospholipid synthase-like methyltransferase
MENKIKKQCPVCNARNVLAFFELLRVPVYCNVQYSSPEETIDVPRRDIHLGFCKLCGHIFNFSFDPEVLKYNQAYENSLHYSPYFQGYAEALAKRLIERYDLCGKHILEIGCGKGEFLTLLCELGNNTGVGFDPSYVPERTEKTAVEKITFIQDYYSERYSNHKVDFICSRHVLEHIQSPRDFLLNLRYTIRDRIETIVFFEVPNVSFILENFGMWDITYEHCSYFSNTSLLYLFQSCGFGVREMREVFDGQFLCLEAFPQEKLSTSRHRASAEVETMTSQVKLFGAKYLSKVEEWRNKLESIENSGQKVVVWGAGTKGVTFLNALRVRDQIKFVVDVNPYKEGKYVAGTGQKIVSPNFLDDYRPNIIIVMNRIYAQEIRGLLNAMNLNPHLMVA